MPTELVSAKPEALAKLNEKIAELKRRAEVIAVVDQQSYIESGQLKLDIVAYEKAVAFTLGPEIEIAKEVLRRLQNEEKMLLAPSNVLLFDLERKRRDWANAERAAAEAEQNRINEAARKEARQNHSKAPDPVRVAPAIPTVPGLRNTVNFKFEVTDPEKVRKAWLIPDLVAIGRKVRADKDPELSAKEIGGIRAWKE